MKKESELIRRFKRGEADAFDDIYTSYYKPVYYYISKLVNDKVLADDLTQETLIKVLRGLKDADEGKPLSPWIFRIAHNTCIDHYRKTRVDYELTDTIITCDTEKNSPEYSLLNKEKQNKIKEVFFKLGHKYQTPLLLRDFKNLSYSDIAALMKLNEATVKTLIRRARLQFQKAYAETY